MFSLKELTFRNENIILSHNSAAIHLFNKNFQNVKNGCVSLRAFSLQTQAN